MVSLPSPRCRVEDACSGRAGRHPSRRAPGPGGGQQREAVCLPITAGDGEAGDTGPLCAMVKEAQSPPRVRRRICTVTSHHS